MTDYDYYLGAAISLLVINAVSFLALLFVIIIYLINWKKINSFPMRIVHLSTRSHSTSVSHASFRIFMYSSTLPWRSTQIWTMTILPPHTASSRQWLKLASISVLSFGRSLLCTRPSPQWCMGICWSGCSISILLLGI